LQVSRKAKFKKIYWVLIGLPAVPACLVLLLLYKPGRYEPPEATYNKQVSPYLTHELLPHIYNNAQLGEPFELTIIQNRTKDIIGLTEWPKQSDVIMVSAPEVFFVADAIVLMGTVAAGGVEFVVTFVLEPRLDREGLLNLRVTKVKVGAMNITPLAKVVAKKMYAQRLATTNIDREDLRAQIAASLLNDEPFEPVFKVEDKKVRVEKISITEGKLTIRLAPTSVESSYDDVQPGYLQSE